MFPEDETELQQCHFECNNDIFYNIITHNLNKALLTSRSTVSNKGNKSNVLKQGIIMTYIAVTFWSHSIKILTAHCPPSWYRVQMPATVLVKKLHRVLLVMLVTFVLGLVFPPLSLLPLALLFVDLALMTSEFPQCTWNIVEANYSQIQIMNLCVLPAM